MAPYGNGMNELFEDELGLDSMVTEEIAILEDTPQLAEEENEDWAYAMLSLSFIYGD